MSNDALKNKFKYRIYSHRKYNNHFILSFYDSYIPNNIPNNI